MSANQAKRGRPTVSIAGLRQSYREVDERERLSFVARHFCNGRTPSQIHKLLEGEFGEVVRREEPYRLLQVAAAEGYFRYYPPLEVELGDRLLDVAGVESAHVIGTGEIDDVCERAAEVLLGLIRQEWDEKRVSYKKTGVPLEAEANRVRIGLAGGYTVRGIVRALVELLKREGPDTVPPSLGFHTVCTGIHYHDSSTDPNAFVTHLLEVPGIEAETFAVPYHAPPTTKPELRDMLDLEPLMDTAAREFELVDILVTSGSSWRVVALTDGGEIQQRPEMPPAGDDDAKEEVRRSGAPSQLRRLMAEHDPDGLEALMDKGVVADLLWQPLSFEKPIELDTNVKAMTLVELRELPELIGGGMKVLLTLGPYGDQRSHKGDVLMAALREHSESDGPLFTHLVCDHRTAGSVVRSWETITPDA